MIQKSNLEEISQNININAEINKQDEINKSQISLPQDSISKTKSKVSENISDSMSKDNDIIESFKDDISDSFIKLKEDEEVKTIKEPEILEEAKYVSLNKRFAVDEKVDSGKMKAVKEAVINYQNSKGTVYESLRLKELIAKCNKYTKGKIFKFGVAAKRLEEVKAVRRAAEIELINITEKEEKLPEDIRQEHKSALYHEMTRNKKFYAADIARMQKDTKNAMGKDKFSEKVQNLKSLVKAIQNEYSGIKYEKAADLAMQYYENGITDIAEIDFDELDKQVSEKLQKKREEKIINRRAEVLQNFFPAMPYKYAHALAAKERQVGEKLASREDMTELFGAKKTEKWIKSHSDLVEKERRIEEERQRKEKIREEKQKRAEEKRQLAEIERRNKKRAKAVVRSNHNAVVAFFCNLIPLQVRNENLEEKLRMIQFSNDIGNKTYFRDSSQKDLPPLQYDDEYENTFI